jgi:hypothetical protein
MRTLAYPLVWGFKSYRAHHSHFRLDFYPKSASSPARLSPSAAHRSRPEVIWCFLREGEKIFLLEDSRQIAKSPYGKDLEGLASALLYSY